MGAILQQDIQHLKKLQRKITKLSQGLQNMDYNDRCQILEDKEATSLIPTRFLRESMTYKHLRKFYSITYLSLFYVYVRIRESNKLIIV